MKLDEELRAILGKKKAKPPLVHFITNYVSMNDVANMTLAFGGRPVMAEAPEEVEEISLSAGALVLNFGTITAERFKLMEKTAHAANRNKVPIVVDPVGAAGSSFRRGLVLELLANCNAAVIKGNGSEIKALAGLASAAAGVDGVEEKGLSGACMKLHEKYGAVVAATGQADLVCGNGRCVRISGGTELLARITGAGCMVSALTAVSLAVSSDPFAAAVLGPSVMKAASAKALGCLRSPSELGSFRVFLFDKVAETGSVDIENGGLLTYEYL